jgi:FtsP/CotA-like multicopper oxidase with cupredoxin domain
MVAGRSGCADARRRSTAFWRNPGIRVARSKGECSAMSAFHRHFLSRRTFLAASGAAATASVLRPWRAGGGSPFEYRLVARPGHAHLVGAPYPETAVWSYNGAIPGPEIRVRQGEHLRIAVENQLAEETTIHWHGLRVPNPMDGVPHVTQKPIAPGEIFLYEFDLPDAGTYWYHPHQRSLEQVGRGLYGPLIVEEREPIQVDRDVTWVLDDWRLLQDAQISDDSATSWTAATTAGSATPSRSTAASWRPSRRARVSACASV